LALFLLVFFITIITYNGLEHLRYCYGAVFLLVVLHDGNHYPWQGQAGAAGFISKIAVSSELASRIRSVFRGDSFVSPSVAKVLIEDHQQKGSRGSRDPYSQLTERERDVLRLAAEGRTTQEIADALVISPKTVEGHKTSLMTKLGIRNRTELIKYALRKGIISV
jgi:two-component system response regulator NreC